MTTTSSPVWELHGNAAQQSIIRITLTHTDFPWHRLIPKLIADTGRVGIPVEWDDLSRYAAHAADGHAHGVDFDLLEGRNRVLGLAWYSGKITLDNRLETDPKLAAEVFLSEAAHMVDFFYMTDGQRTAVFNAFHSDAEDVPADAVITDGLDFGHGHGWFDVGGYYAWVGEAFMGGFVKAFSDVPVTIDFDHQPSPGAVAEIRRALLTAWPFGLVRSKVFHDEHQGIKSEVEWPTVEAARLERRPCRTCKPGRV